LIEVPKDLKCGDCNKSFKLLEYYKLHILQDHKI